MKKIATNLLILWDFGISAAMLFYTHVAKVISVSRGSPKKRMSKFPYKKIT